jgi:hypothetical protein
MRTKVWLEILKLRHHSEDLDENGRKKMDFREIGRGLNLASIGFLQQLSDY